MKQHHTLGILSLTCAALLTACGGGAPAPGTGDGGGGGGSSGTALTISGTLSVPNGQTLSGAQVVACYQGKCDNAKSKQVAASKSGTFSITGLEKVQYALIAFQDVDGDQTVGEGDLQGLYSQDGTTPTPVTPPAQNIDIALEVQGTGGGGGGSTDLTISGKLTVPSGQTVNGAQVLACYQGDCGSAKSKQVPVSASGTYSLTGLEKVEYGILAFKDLNGDKNIDAQDLQGRSDAPVTPPAQNVNIALALKGGGGGSGTGGTIAGKVTAPKGKNVGGTLIVLCAEKCIVQVEMDATNSATASYVTDELPAEEYQVIALKDNDMSGTVSEGDYVGFYSKDGSEAALVTPPATGIDIVMELAPADSNNSASTRKLNRALSRARSEVR